MLKIFKYLINKLSPFDENFENSTMTRRWWEKAKLETKSCWWKIKFRWKIFKIERGIYRVKNEERVTQEQELQQPDQSDLATKLAKALEKYSTPEERESFSRKMHAEKLLTDQKTIGILMGKTNL